MSFTVGFGFGASISHSWCAQGRPAAAVRTHGQTMRVVCLTGCKSLQEDRPALRALLFSERGALLPGLSAGLPSVAAAARQLPHAHVSQSVVCLNSCRFGVFSSRRVVSASLGRARLLCTLMNMPINLSGLYHGFFPSVSCRCFAPLPPTIRSGGGGRGGWLSGWVFACKSAEPPGLASGNRWLLAGALPLATTRHAGR